MDRLKGLGSFALVAGMVLVGLRLLHVVVPVVYPPAGPGPYVVDTPARAAELAGFTPWMPSYRPQRAGGSPSFTVTRLGRPRIVVDWRGERWLRLTQRVADGGRGLEGGGEGRQALARRGRLEILVETDLDERDLERVVGSLRPGFR